MQHEIKLASFIATVVESILRLNDGQNSKDNDKIYNKFGVKFFGKSNIAEKVSENLERSSTKKVWVEFVLMDKHNGERIYPLELWTFNLEANRIQDSSSEFELIENINMDNTCYLEKRSKLALKSILNKFISGPAFTYNNLEKNEYKKSQKLTKLKTRFILIQNHYFKEKDLVSRNHPKWQTAEKSEYTIKNSKVCLTISHSTTNNILDFANTLSFKEDYAFFEELFQDEKQSKRNSLNIPQNRHRQRFLSDHVPSINPILNNLKISDDFFGQKAMSFTKTYSNSDFDAVKPFNLASNIWKEKDLNTRKLSARTYIDDKTPTKINDGSLDIENVEYFMNEDLFMDDIMSKKSNTMSTRFKNSDVNERKLSDYDDGVSDMYSNFHSNSTKTNNFCICFKCLAKKVMKESEKNSKFEFKFDASPPISKRNINFSPVENYL